MIKLLLIGLLLAPIMAHADEAPTPGNSQASDPIGDPIEEQYRAGDYAKTIASCDDFIKNNPRSGRLSEIYLLRGRALEKINRDAESIPAYQRVIDLAPASETADRALFLILRAQHERKSYNSILTSYQYIFRHLPPSMSKWRALSYLLAADAYQNLNQLDEAAAVAEMVAKVYDLPPIRFFAYEALAKCYRGKGEDGKARDNEAKMKELSRDPEAIARFSELDDQDLEGSPFERRRAKKLLASAFREPSRPAIAAPESAAERPAPGPSREEIQRMVAQAAKEAVAATRKDESSPATPISDVDHPKFHETEDLRDFAVIVGIEKYSNDLPEAQFAERDAEAVRANLVALGYPERNIKSLIGSHASKSNLEAYLEDWLPRNIKPDSRVLFYFSGHGAPDPRSNNAYLVPWDSNPNFLDKTAYSVKKLYKDLNALKAERVMVVLDSCFSGVGGRSLLAEGTRPLVTKVDLSVSPRSKILLFAAAQPSEVTGTLKDQGHGIFTYYFLKGLEGGAKNESGAITPEGLFSYLKPLVQDAASRQNRDQTPVLAGALDRAGFKLH